MLVTTPGAHPMDSLVGLKPRGRQTLVVDQAEEAVTLCTDPAERARYVAALAVHVGAGGALALSLRADHLGDFAPYPDIARVLEDGLYLLGPMSETGLRSAIEGPARRAGLRLEPGLVDLLVREVEGEPAALPLLSHALRETWERREGPTLTVAGYRATGGIRQAVARSAESVYDAMDATQRSQLRSLLLRLVMPTRGRRPVRARVPRAKVAVDRGARAASSSGSWRRGWSASTGTSVQIAHEALVRVWPRLRGWLDDDVDGQRLFRHLAGAADAWESMGRPDSELYRGTRLSRTVDWRDADPPGPERHRVRVPRRSRSRWPRRSNRLRETRATRERRARRRLRGALAGVAALLVLAAGRRQSSPSVLPTEPAGDRERREAAALSTEARRAGAQAATQETSPPGLLLARRGPPHRRLRTRPATTSPRRSTRAGPLVGVRDAGGLAVSMSAEPGRVAAGRQPRTGRGRTLGPPLRHPVTGDRSSSRTAPRHPASSGSRPTGDSSRSRSTSGSRTGSSRCRGSTSSPFGSTTCRAAPWPAQQLGGLPEGSSIEYALDYSA